MSETAPDPLPRYCGPYLRENWFWKIAPGSSRFLAAKNAPMRGYAFSNCSAVKCRRYGK